MRIYGHTPKEHLARYGANVESDAAYNHAANTQSKTIRRGERIGHGLDSYSTGYRSTAAYVGAVTAEANRIAAGRSGISGNAIIRNRIGEDAKSGAWAIARRAAAVAIVGAVVAAGYEMYQHNNADSSQSMPAVQVSFESGEPLAAMPQPVDLTTQIPLAIKPGLS